MKPLSPDTWNVKMTSIDAVREWSRADLDKPSWGEGPWLREPDKVQWVDEATGLDCLIVRQPRAGHLCGYVGVGPDHPWHGKGYSSCVEGCGEDWCGHSPDSLVRVHGGLTFADACAESEDPAHGICHVAEPGRPEHVWWFGFDCAHGGDLSPATEAYFRDRNPALCSGGWLETYKDRSYVEGEIRRLARQIADVLPTNSEVGKPLLPPHERE